jgi:hypothetical protein
MGVGRAKLGPKERPKGKYTLKRESSVRERERESIDYKK